MLAIFAFSHTGYHIYDEVFNSPHECSWRTISLPVRCLSPQLQLLVTTVTLHSPFPLTSGTHSIYVGTIGLLAAWRQVFVFIWRPLCKRSGLLNRVRYFLSVLCLVCIQADLPSGIAHSISLCTLLERRLMLSIHQLTCTRVLDGSGFLSRHNLSTIQQGIAQITASFTTALLVTWLPLTRIQQMPWDLFHFWNRTRYFTVLSASCHEGGQSINLSIMILLVGRRNEKALQFCRSHQATTH